MKKLIFLFAILFMGCSVTKPSITEYRLESKEFYKYDKSLKCKSKTIKIIQAFSGNNFRSKSMYYIVDQNKQYSYVKSQWAIPINKLITQNIFNMFSGLGLYKNVLNYKSRAQGDYVLESEVEDFSQYFNKELTSSAVKISLNLTLIDSQRNKVIASKRFVKIKQSNTLDANGGVEALKLALDEILKDISTWMIDECN